MSEEYGSSFSKTLFPILVSTISAMMVASMTLYYFLERENSVEASISNEVSSSLSQIEERISQLESFTNFINSRISKLESS